MKVMKSAVLLIPVIVLGILFIISFIFEIIFAILRDVKATIKPLTPAELDEPDSSIDAEMDLGTGWSQDK